MSHPYRLINKETLRRAWLDRHLHLSPTQDVLRYTAFRLIRVGRAASDQLLGDQTELSPATVDRELAELEQQGLMVRDDRGVVGIFGLSLVRTPHALCLAGHPLYTWCALDAVGIPAGLAADATVRSTCFFCRQEIVLELRAGSLTTMSAAGASLWLTMPGQGPSTVSDT